MNIIENGLYSVSDSYFTNFPDRHICDNKNENRPYFVSFIDNDNITWLIPLSSQVNNYKNKIAYYEHKYKICLFYHIGKIMGEERAFLIGNMFPITDKYIKKPYTFGGTHYVIGDKQLIKELRKRVKKYLVLVEQGKIKTNIDIMTIRNELLDDNMITV